MDLYIIIIIKWLVRCCGVATGGRPPPRKLHAPQTPSQTGPPGLMWSDQWHGYEWHRRAHAPNDYSYVNSFNV